MDDRKSKFEKDGRIWFRGLLSGGEIERFREQLSDPSAPGKRNIKMAKSVSDKLLIITHDLGLDAKIRSSALFYKRVGSSWSLPWHQDRTIAMETHIDDPAYSKWSRKDGTWYCEPPISDLKLMCFAHILLDDVTADNGPMEIALGSHIHGHVSRADINSVIGRSRLEACTGQAGDVALLKYLILHRSRRSLLEKPRRTLRVNFGPATDCVKATVSPLHSQRQNP